MVFDKIKTRAEQKVLEKAKARLEKGGLDKFITLLDSMHWYLEEIKKNGDKLNEKLDSLIEVIKNKDEGKTTTNN